MCHWLQASRLLSTLHYMPYQIYIRVWRPQRNVVLGVTAKKDVQPTRQPKTDDIDSTATHVTNMRLYVSLASIIKTLSILLSSALGFHTGKCELRRGRHCGQGAFSDVVRSCKLH